MKVFLPPIHPGTCLLLQCWLGRRTCDQQIPGRTLPGYGTWMGDRLWEGKPSGYVPVT